MCPEYATTWESLEDTEWHIHSGPSDTPNTVYFPVSRGLSFVAERLFQEYTLCSVIYIICFLTHQLSYFFSSYKYSPPSLQVSLPPTSHLLSAPKTPLTMAVFIRSKRVSDPLDDKVKARLLRAHHCCMSIFASSNSDQEADADSFLFSNLINGFLEGDDQAPSETTIPDSCDDDSSVDDSIKTVRCLLSPSRNSDTFRFHLQSHVAQTTQLLSGLRWSGSRYRRAVMTKLREIGYNAGICKASWEKSGGLSAGSYEYIDVVASEGKRYIVELEFAAEFEVARATDEYRNLMETLPCVMVARSEVVKQVVRIVNEEARRSLKKNELHVPPWRKNRYMLAKWLGDYTRTLNIFPANVGAAVKGGEEVKCRAVGFGLETRPIRMIR